MLTKLAEKLQAWICRIPLDKALRLGRRIGWFYGHILRHRRRYVLETLARAFPEKTDEERVAIADEMYELQAVNLIEMLRFCNGNDESFKHLLVARNEERVRDARERGNGVLILIAHYGNYDMMGVAAARLFAYPLSIVTKTFRNKTVNRIWQSARGSSGATVIPSHNAYRACVKALKRNDLVGFMLDQNRPGRQGIFVDFFGRTASTSPGLAFLSAQTGAPVIPVFMQRNNAGGHVLDVLEPIEPPPDRKEETILAYTQRYTKVIEDQIRQHPEQWLWIHKRWKTRPPEEEETA